VLTTVWPLVSNGVVFADLGADYLRRIDINRSMQRLLKRVSHLGCRLKADLSLMNASRNLSDQVRTSGFSWRLDGLQPLTPALCRNPLRRSRPQYFVLLVE
jgi:hypothetical protein